MTQKLRAIKKKSYSEEEFNGIKSIEKKPENYTGLFAMLYFVPKDKIYKQEKGITLIALVVTVIVLLVLAGVSISMLTGQNRNINKSGRVII